MIPSMDEKTNRKVLKKAWGAVKEGQFDLALEELSSFKPSTPAQHREAEHIRAKIYFVQNRWKEAKAILEASIRIWGPHVGSLSDLVACHYLLNEKSLWETSTSRLEDELLKAESILSTSSRNATVLVLAKCFEERGQIAKAINFYKELVESAPSNEERQLKYICQLVRLLSYLGLKKDLTHYYRQLVSHSFSFADDLIVEIQHAMILAEGALISMDAGIGRFKFLLNRLTLNEIDLSLIYFDLL